MIHTYTYTTAEMMYLSIYTCVPCLLMWPSLHLNTHGAVDGAEQRLCMHSVFSHLLAQHRASSITSPTNAHYWQRIALAQHLVCCKCAICTHTHTYIYIYKSGKRRFEHSNGHMILCILIRT